MKKTLITAAVLGLFGLSTSATAQPFCATCHDGHKDKTGPSIQKIVMAYGSVDAVFKTMDSSAVLEPKMKKFAKNQSMMEGQHERYRRLSAEEKGEVRQWFEDQLK